MTTPPDRKRGSTSARQKVASRSLISVSADRANSGLANRVIGLPGIYNRSMNIRSRRMRPSYLNTNIAAKSDDDWDQYKRTVSLDHGERIFFVDIGEGPGPVLLLIHGLGGSWQAWLANIRPLAEAYRVVAVDLPGFGASPLVPGCFTFSAYARVMDRFCECLGINSVVAVGHSF